MAIYEQLSCFNNSNTKQKKINGQFDKPHERFASQNVNEKKINKISKIKFILQH